MDEQEKPNWQYNPNEGREAHQHQTAGAVSWQAPEFIEHQHGSGWYAALVTTTLVIAVLVYLTSKDIFATITILVVGVIVGVFAGHKPQQVTYEVGSRGLSINGKLYPYGSYKSFTVLHEGPLSSVNLFPLKRFMPPISAYFVPADEQKVVDALGDNLPYEERKMDNIDRLSRRLRL
jgi:hypothetical protein